MQDQNLPARYSLSLSRNLKEIALLYTPICLFQIPYRKPDRAINADDIIDDLLRRCYFEQTNNRELKFPHNHCQNIFPRLCSPCCLLSRKNFLFHSAKPIATSFSFSLLSQSRRCPSISLF